MRPVQRRGIRFIPALNKLWKIVLVTYVLLVATQAEDVAEELDNNSRLVDPSASEISAEEFEEVVSTGSQLIIDVRDSETAQLERVDAKRFVNIPLDDVETSLDLPDDDFKWMYDVDKPELDEEFVFICEDGRKSEEASKLAESLNYINARYLVGGRQHWIKERPNFILEIHDGSKEQENATTTFERDEL